MEPNQRRCRPHVSSQTHSTAPSSPPTAPAHTRPHNHSQASHGHSSHQPSHSHSPGCRCCDARSVGTHVGPQRRSRHAIVATWICSIVGRTSRAHTAHLWPIVASVASSHSMHRYIPFFFPFIVRPCSMRTWNGVHLFCECRTWDQRQHLQPSTQYAFTHDKTRQR
jgi:hypothetical protein